MFGWFETKWTMLVPPTNNVIHTTCHEDGQRCDFLLDGMKKNTKTQPKITTIAANKTWIRRFQRAGGKERDGLKFTLLWPEKDQQWCNQPDVCVIHTATEYYHKNKREYVRNKERKRRVQFTKASPRGAVYMDKVMSERLQDKDVEGKWTEWEWERVCERETKTHAKAVRTAQR